jgi:glycosyltransferase 2 family protein
MSTPANMIWGRKRTLMAFFVSATILVVLAVKVNLRLHAPGGPQPNLMGQLAQVKWPIILAAFAFSAFWHTVVGADKWCRILRALGADVPWGEVFRVRLGSDPIRFAAPLKTGEIVNAAYFSRLPTFGFSRAAGSIAFDKAVNFFGTLVWLYVGIAALAQVPPAGHILLHTGMGAALVALLVLRWPRDMLRHVGTRVHPKIGRLLAGVLAAFEEFSLRRKVAFLAYGVVFQLRPLIVCYLLFAAINANRLPSLEELVAFGSVAVLMSNIPLTVAGIGPREATIMALFAPYGDPLTLLVVGILMSFSIHVIPAIIGIPFMFGLLRALAAQPSPVPTTAVVDSPVVAADSPVMVTGLGSEL